MAEQHQPPGKKTRKRRLASESLEPRQMLHADLGIHADHVGHDHSHHSHDHHLMDAAELDAHLQTHQDEGRAVIEDHHHHHDATLHYNELGQPYYADPIMEIWDRDAISPPSLHSTQAKFSSSSVPILHSNPNASQKLYLDFDGQTIFDNSWTNNNDYQTIHAPPFDLDGDITTFNTAEMDIITETWIRMADDFAAFDVDVTTEDPGASVLSAGGQGVRLMFSTDIDDTRVGGTGNRWYTGASGVAYLRSFDWSFDTVAWVFANRTNRTGKQLAEVGSHELGHTLGLSHDGTTSGTEYYAGQSGGQTSWAPIMGNSFSRNMTHWSRGEYNGANNTQNDISIMAGRLGYRADDHTNQLNANSATMLTASPEINASGYITRSFDIDVFRLNVPVMSNLSLLADGPIGQNLDIEATLYDSSGSIVAQDNPKNLADASIELESLAAGTYLLAIDGVGKNDPATNGYSDYSSIGQFFLTGSLEPSDSVAGAPVVAGTPIVNATFEPTSLTLTFDQNVDETTFSIADDILLTDPTGADATALITGYALTDRRELELSFLPLTMEGDYTLTVGPEIFDFEGLRMDQNLNGTDGESDDAYIHSFYVLADTLPGVAPFVVAAPVLDNPSAPSSVTYTYNQFMDATSFDPAEDIPAFTGPNGVVPITGYEWTSNATLRVDFDQLTTVGDYTLFSGEYIFDLEGLPLDQNQNGIPADLSDFYLFNFTVTGGLTGDFDGDGLVNAVDIDLLCGEINAGTHQSMFDMNADGFVDADDQLELVVNVIGSLPGDANLDFVVDTSDLNIWSGNKFQTGRGWGTGDFNCDGFTDTSDLNIWSANKFQIGSGGAAGLASASEDAAPTELTRLDLMYSSPANSNDVDEDNSDDQPCPKCGMNHAGPC